MTFNDLLMWIGIVLGGIAIIGIAVTLWSACARSGQISLTQVQELVRREWPEEATRFDANQEAAVRMGGNAAPETIIVTRHAGLVEWLAAYGITGEVKAQVSAADVSGKIVVGALPLHLAALAHEVIAVDLSDLKPEQRGQDLTPQEMDAAGARLSRYVVRRVFD